MYMYVTLLKIVLSECGSSKPKPIIIVKNSGGNFAVGRFDQVPNGGPVLIVRTVCCKSNYHMITMAFHVDTIT